MTAIGILTSGYAQLLCGHSVYHWEIIIYLAWHSSLTHLTTLAFLREYFHNNAVARIWRAILMLSIAIMLSVALLPTGDRRWVPNVSDDMKTLSAWCASKRLVRQKPSERFQVEAVWTSEMLSSIMVLSSSYFTRLTKLSGRATAFVKLWMKTKPGNLIKFALNKSVQRAIKPHASGYWRLKHFVMETMYILLRVLFDVIESLLWEVCLLLPQ